VARHTRGGQPAAPPDRLTPRHALRGPILWRSRFSWGSLFVGQAFQPAAGFPAGLGTLYPLLSFTQSLPRWSKPPGLPCRRSRRQSDTVPNGTGVPTPSGPHDCALHLKPPPRRCRPACPPPLFHLRVLRGLFSPCSPCSLWFVFPVPSMSCPMWGRLSSLRPAFQPALAPLPTALCSTQCCVL